MIIDDPAVKSESRLSTTTLNIEDESQTQNTLAWTRLLLDRDDASDLTLAVLGSPRPIPPPLVFVFSQDSLLNATISLFDQPMYSLRSDAQGTRTQLLSLDDLGAAELLWTYKRGLISSSLVDRDGRSVSVGKFLRPSKSKPEGARNAIIFDCEGVAYEWRIDMMGEMACYIAGAPMIDPVAWFNRSKKLILWGEPVVQSAAMVMKDAVAYGTIRDHIIISWILASENARTWPYNTRLWL